MSRIALIVVFVGCLVDFRPCVPRNLPLRPPPTPRPPRRRRKPSPSIVARPEIGDQLEQNLSVSLELNSMVRQNDQVLEKSKTTLASRAAPRGDNHARRRRRRDGRDGSVRRGGERNRHRPDRRTARRIETNRPARAGQSVPCPARRRDAVDQRRAGRDPAARRVRDRRAEYGIARPTESARRFPRGQIRRRGPADRAAKRSGRKTDGPRRRAGQGHALRTHAATSRRRFTAASARSSNPASKPSRSTRRRCGWPSTVRWRSKSTPAGQSRQTLRARLA